VRHEGSRSVRSPTGGSLSHPHHLCTVAIAGHTLETTLDRCLARGREWLPAGVERDHKYACHAQEHQSMRVFFDVRMPFSVYIWTVLSLGIAAVGLCVSFYALSIAWMLMRPCRTAVHGVQVDDLGEFGSVDAPDECGSSSTIDEIIMHNSAECNGGRTYSIGSDFTVFPSAAHDGAGSSALTPGAEEAVVTRGRQRTLSNSAASLRRTLSAGSSLNKLTNVLSTVSSPRRFARAPEPTTAAATSSEPNSERSESAAEAEAIVATSALRAEPQSSRATDEKLCTRSRPCLPLL